MNNSQPLIRLSGYRRSYGDIQAVNRVDMSVDTGEFVAIIGASGSGKSTLLGMLGLLESPTGGSYHFAGAAVSDLDDAAQSKLRNQTFGFVFQQFHLLPELTAVENVARPLQYSGVNRRDRRQRAFELLKKFGLGHRAGHRPAQLSGGEQQRVAIARALINNPQVILADEPTGSLPQAQWQQVLDTLRELNDEGRTIIMVTHEPLVAKQAARQLVMQDGQIVED